MHLNRGDSKIRIHYLQHVPFENLANIEIWAKEKGHFLSVTRLYLDEELPTMEQFDWLIVLGGPMNIYEEGEYPWLIAEKIFIKEAILNDKFILGICLGAQLIAHVLGGKVKKNSYKEIGWYPVTRTPEASNSVFFNFFPDLFMAFHWHGDTFEIPPGAIKLAESRGCQNQAFEYNGKILGLQFHLESSKDSVERLIENCRNEMNDTIYIQNENEILSHHDYLEQIRRNLVFLLNIIESIFFS